MQSSPSSLAFLGLGVPASSEVQTCFMVVIHDHFDASINGEGEEGGGSPNVFER